LFGVFTYKCGDLISKYTFSNKDERFLIFVHDEEIEEFLEKEVNIPKK